MAESREAGLDERRIEPGSLEEQEPPRAKLVVCSFWGDTLVAAGIASGAGISAMIDETVCDVGGAGKTVAEFRDGENPRMIWVRWVMCGSERFIDDSVWVTARSSVTLLISSLLFLLLLLLVVMIAVTVTRAAGAGSATGADWWAVGRAFSEAVRGSFELIMDETIFSKSSAVMRRSRRLRELADESWRQIKGRGKS
jgi:hypothetical protein